MNRSVAALCLCLCSCLVVGAEQADASVNCDRPGEEVDIANGLYDVVSLSSLNLVVASGNIKQAQDEIGLSIAAQVTHLNIVVAHDPCHVFADPSAAKSRIYPRFRIIAAANHKVPIPHVNDDVQIMKILDSAVADNPAHYEQLLKRSEAWSGGIK